MNLQPLSEEQIEKLVDHNRVYVSGSKAEACLLISIGYGFAQQMVRDMKCSTCSKHTNYLKCKIQEYTDIPTNPNSLCDDYERKP